MLHQELEKIRNFAERVEQYMEANDNYEPEEDTGKTIEADMREQAQRALNSVEAIAANLGVSEEE